MVGYVDKIKVYIVDDQEGSLDFKQGIVFKRICVLNTEDNGHFV